MKIMWVALTDMANEPFLAMKLAMPVSLSPSLPRWWRGARTRCASFTLIVLCGLSAGNADAAKWVKVVDNKTYKILVDTDSIIGTGGIVAAWYRRNFDRPMAAEKGSQLYRSAEVLNYYNCSEREIAPAQWITYEKLDGRGKIISNERVSSLEYGDISADGANQAIFEFVCKYIKTH